jgi:membrane protease subunit (stomatin/prohibitin family)
MGLFGWGDDGAGFSDVIRCDEPEYLVWKWRPSGAPNSTKRENAIRYGSSLRVKDGELAVFVYQNGSGDNQDFIYGPHDRTIQTGNFPILSSIVGMAFGGKSPFQAEVYFINLAGNIQIRFGVPYFDVFDPRFMDFAVPIAARGTLTFNIRDPREFIKLNRLINFDLEMLKTQIKDAVVKYVKGIITNAPQSYGIPVLQIERSLLEVSEIVAAFLRERLSRDFGVNIKDFDISAIEVQKESPGYKELRSITADLVKNTTIAQNELTIKNMQDAQRIGATNAEESLKVGRQESQRGQRLKTESANLAAHTANLNADVLRTAAGNMGSAGNVNLGGGGFNPGTMMAGMAVGGAVGNQIAGMMNSMNSNVPPPPPPSSESQQFYISNAAAVEGPYQIQQLVALIQAGRLTAATNVIPLGGTTWVAASQVPTLAPFFPKPAPPTSDNNV